MKNNMSIKKLERNLEIVNLINQGISYRNIVSFLNISLSRIEAINNIYNKNKFELSHCVRCGSQSNLFLKDKIRNICKNCIKEIKSY
jgi:hypothetical protein